MKAKSIARITIAVGVLGVLSLPVQHGGASAAPLTERVAARIAISAADIGGEGARVLRARLDPSPPSGPGQIPSRSWVFSLRPNSRRVTVAQFTAVVDAYSGKLTYVWYVGGVDPTAEGVNERWPLLHLRSLSDADLFGHNFLLYQPNASPMISRSQSLRRFHATRIGRAAQIHEMVLARVWSLNWGPAQGHVLDWVIAATIPGGRWEGEFPGPYMYTLVDAHTGEVIPILSCGTQPAWK